MFIFGTSICPRLRTFSGEKITLSLTLLQTWLSAAKDKKLFSDFDSGIYHINSILSVQYLASTFVVEIAFQLSA